jgi:hypothetical protein
MMLTRSTRREETIRRQIAAVRRRDRLAGAMCKAVVEAVDFGSRDLATPEDHDWLEATIADCVESSIDAEIDLVAHLLAEALESAPHRLADRYDRSHEAEDYGLD